MIIFVIIFSFALGVFVSSLVFVPPLIASLLLLVAGAILLSEYLWHQHIQRAVLFIAIAILSISAGIFRYNIKDFHPLPAELESQAGTEMTLEGLVVSEPEAKENSTRFVVGTDSEKILVSTDLYSRVKYGDKIKSVGKLEKPGMIENDLGKNFDYGKSLSKDDIYYLQSFAEVEVLSSGHGNPLKSKLLGLKQSLVSRIRMTWPEPQASLMSGLIVAGKDAMSKSILEDFRRAGVVHIVVLSGFNIAIISVFFLKIFEVIFNFLKIRNARKFGAVASLLGIILFVLMAGAETAIVRAAVMASIATLGILAGRRYHASRALLLAAFLMLWHNPKILVFNPSFQLSFLATMGLIHLAPVFERYFKAVPDKFGFRSILSTIIAAQIFVLPFLVYLMGEISTVSLASNLLILFLVPTTMFIGFLSTALSYLGQMAALPFAYITHLLLSWILGVSQFLGGLKFAAVAVSFPIWAVVISYLALGSMVMLSKNYSRLSAN